MDIRDYVGLVLTFPFINGVFSFIQLLVVDLRGRLRKREHNYFSHIKLNALIDSIYTLFSGVRFKLNILRLILMMPLLLTNVLIYLSMEKYLSMKNI